MGDHLNRVPALIGWNKGGNIISAGWQVTLSDATSPHNGEACSGTAIPAMLA